MAAEPGLLRVATAGSVDDGKSTLIGRLLHDSRSVLDDQLAGVERISRARGDDRTDLSLLTDGLRAEREQGITIDVAYRAFATPRRRFLLADTPGHAQYLRNTVTGASTADVALLLVDARRGVTEQTRRHAYLASLLGVPHLVLLVNKMDLVGWSREVFTAVAADFARYAAGLHGRAPVAIPVSALLGDNVVDAGAHTPWYEGAPLLPHLERLRLDDGPTRTGVRLPVQLVLRAGAAETPGLAGTMAAGVLRPGDRVVVLPSGAGAAVAAIDGPEGPVAEAFPPMAVVVRLEDGVGADRGDLLCAPDDLATTTDRLEADVCWMDDRAPLEPGRVYALKHTTRWVEAAVTEVVHRVDVNTLDRDGTADRLALNEIGRVRLTTSAPLTVDAYQDNRTTGSFILVDGTTNRTVGAGVVTTDRGA